MAITKTRADFQHDYIYGVGFPDKENRVTYDDSRSLQGPVQHSSYRLSRFWLSLILDLYWRYVCKNLINKQTSSFQISTIRVIQSITSSPSTLQCTPKQRISDRGSNNVTKTAIKWMHGDGDEQETLKERTCTLRTKSMKRKQAISSITQESTY